MDKSWDEVYINLAVLGFEEKNMPSSNRIWHEYLDLNGYKRKFISDVCPTCYTLSDFANEYNIGSYIVGLDGHVVAVIDGKYYDTWDSGNEYPLFYWSKEI